MPEFNLFDAYALIRRNKLLGYQNNYFYVLKNAKIKDSPYGGDLTDKK